MTNLKTLKTANVAIILKRKWSYALARDSILVASIRRSVDHRATMHLWVIDASRLALIKVIISASVRKIWRLFLLAATKIAMILQTMGSMHVPKHWSLWVIMFAATKFHWLGMKWSTSFVPLMKTWKEYAAPNLFSLMSKKTKILKRLVSHGTTHLISIIQTQDPRHTCSLSLGCALTCLWCLKMPRLAAPTK